jgi:CRP/FNR family transcriptional regulator, cyclic AMP receptor protein
MFVNTKMAEKIEPVGIEDSELFRDLPKEQLISQIKAMSRTETYPAGTVIFREDEPADQLWLLRSGRVRLVFTEPAGWAHGEFLITHIKPGQAFGWTTLSGQEKMMAQAVAVEDCEAFLIPISTLQQLMNDDMEFGYHVMHRMLRVMGTRLRDTRAQLRWLLLNS